MKGQTKLFFTIIIILNFVYTSKSKQSNSQVDKYAFRRPVSVGDTFTPQELVPVAKRLRAKVINPGSSWKGIVSSSKGAEELADNLFEGFFFTKKRFVILQDYDIAGIDALQALALSGSDAEQYILPEPKNNIPYRKMQIEGQFIYLDDKKPSSQYSLIAKKVEARKSEKNRRVEKIGNKENINRLLKNHKIKKKKSKEQPKRTETLKNADAKNNAQELTRKPEIYPRAVKLIQKLAKKRRLKVNVDRKQFEKQKHVNRTFWTRTKIKNNNSTRIQKSEATNDRVSKTNEKAKKKSVENQKIVLELNNDDNNNNHFTTASPIKKKEPKIKSGCRWRYVCRNPIDLPTCRLESYCKSDEFTTEDGIVVSHKDENTEYIKQFRRMLGITIVDEEVEKIVERRYFEIMAKKKSYLANNQQAENKILGLGEYFDKVMYHEYLKSTTPAPPITIAPEVLKEFYAYEEKLRKENETKIVAVDATKDEDPHSKQHLHKPSIPTSTQKIGDKS